VFLPTCWRRTHMPQGERADLRPSAVLSREQPLERGRIGARHVEYLLPASRPCHHRDRATADSERRSHQCQHSRSGLAVYGSLADPDHQSLVVVPAHAGTGRSGPDPDNDTHPASVRPHAAWWPGTAARTGLGTGECSSGESVRLVVSWPRRLRVERERAGPAGPHVLDMLIEVELLEQADACGQ
jgi:hypothetical protein